MNNFFNHSEFKNLMNILTNKKNDYPTFIKLINNHSITDFFKLGPRDFCKKDRYLSLPIMALYNQNAHAIRYCLEQDPFVFSKVPHMIVDGIPVDSSSFLKKEISDMFFCNMILNFQEINKNIFLNIYEKDPQFVINLLYQYHDISKHKASSFDFKSRAIDDIYQITEFIFNNHDSFSDKDNKLPKDIFYLFYRTIPNINSHVYKKTLKKHMYLCNINNEELHTNPDIIYSFFDRNILEYVLEHLEKFNLKKIDNHMISVGENRNKQTLSSFLYGYNIEIFDFLNYFYTNIFNSENRKDFIINNGEDFYLRKMIDLSEEGFQGRYKKYFNITKHPIGISYFTNNFTLHSTFLNFVNNSEEILETNDEDIKDHRISSQFLSLVLYSEDKNLFTRFLNNPYLKDKEKILEHLLKQTCSLNKKEESIKNYIDIILESKNELLGYKAPILLPQQKRNNYGYRYLEKLKIFDEIKENTSENNYDKKRL